MGRGRELTDEERGRIRGLREAGVAIRAIARKTKRSPTCVRNALQPQQPTKTSTRGRKTLLTTRDVRRLLRAAATGAYTAAQLKDALDFSVSARTIRRVLSGVDWLVYTKMDSTLPLTPAHKQARQSWAKTHVTMGKEWDGVIFSDEKRFNLDGPDAYKDYWRDLRRPPRETVRRQNGGGSVMIWAAFSAKGKSEVAVLVGRQASEHYVYTLSEYLLPFAHLHYGADFIYQQDNASIHTSEETTAFLEDQQVTVMKWPARSPDLNPIENLWSMLAAKVYANGKQYYSVSELTSAILAAWTAIGLDTLRTLVDSMPKRCIEVIELRGCKTHY